MSSQYKYRPHLKYLKIIVPSILVAFIAILWLLFLLFLGNYDELVFPLIVFTVIFGLEAFFIWRLMHRFMIIRVAIDHETITYTNYKGDTRIKYEDIKCLKFPSIRYTGGWIKIISAKGIIRLTVVIENIQGLLSELKVELDHKGLSDTYHKKKFYKFLKTSAFSDMSWQRVYQIWIKLVIVTILTTIVGLGTTWFFDVAQFQGLILIMFSFLFPTVIYVITEIVFGRRFSKLSSFETFTVPGPDKVYENVIYRKAILMGIVVYFAIILLVILWR